MAKRSESVSKSRGRASQSVPSPSKCIEISKGVDGPMNETLFLSIEEMKVLKENYVSILH